MALHKISASAVNLIRKLQLVSATGGGVAGEVSVLYSLYWRLEWCWSTYSACSILGSNLADE